MNQLKPHKHTIVRKLSIRRYRGLEALDWRPDPTLNLILGGGDVGKTTILDAVGLLLSASNATTVSETDYWRRDNMTEFSIEGVVALPDGVDPNSLSVLLMPWEWNGQDAVLPGNPQDGDVAEATNPVYRLRVRGTPDLELVWEVVQPDDSTVALSAAFRKKIGLIRLSADDRNDRDLRLVFGSALDRLLADPAIKARIAKQVAEQDFAVPVGDDGRKALELLDKRLIAASLPHGVQLGLTSSQGLSIGALIGLLADRDGVALPLASWGAGTRRMAALEIAAATQADNSVTVIDEVERGLEPYRLRQLIAMLQSTFGQCFVTTHSPVAINCARWGKLWYLDPAGRIGELAKGKIDAQQQRDPETFLAKLAVVAEGPTEIGFLRRLLELAFKGDFMNFGVRLCDGQGNPQTLSLLEALGEARLSFAAIADDENENGGRWARVKQAMGDRLLRWDGACTEKIVIDLLPEALLPELLKMSDGTWNGERLRTLATRLGIENKSFSAISAVLATNSGSLRQVIIAAATGDPAGAPEGEKKEWKAHARHWFKSRQGGCDLAGYALADDVWPKLEPTVLPLLNSIITAVGLPAIESLDRV
jgi:putative ATP-dependent endonuclease of the OLD family